MPGSWYALHAQFLKKSQSLHFHQQYQAMRAGREPLEPFPDPRRLLDYLRGPGGTPEAKNRVLQAVLASRHAHKDVAFVTLTLGLWPALDRAYRQLRLGFPGDPENIAGELIGAFAIGCGKADPAKVKKIAATLSLSARRDATRALTQQQKFTGMLDPDIESSVAAADTADDEPEACDETGDFRALVERLLEDFGTDVGLVVDVAVHGLTQREAAERRGLPYTAARKRYQRTTARMRTKAPDYLRPRVPSPSIDWHLRVDHPRGGDDTKGDRHEIGERGTRTDPGALPVLGAAGSSADRRRVPDRAGRANHGRGDSRRGVPPRR